MWKELLEITENFIVLYARTGRDQNMEGSQKLLIHVSTSKSRIIVRFTVSRR